MTKSDIKDYRGLHNLVYAEIIEDTKDNYITGTIIQEFNEARSEYLESGKKSRPIEELWEELSI